MLDLTPRQIGCTEFRRTLQGNRRWFLKAGALGLAGLSLPQLLQHEALAIRRPARTRSSSSGCGGGRATSTCGIPSRTPRSNFAASSAPMATNVPGIQLTDMLPQDRRRSWTSGRSSAACITTTPAIPPATRSASPATTPAPTPTRTSSRVAARSWRSNWGT